MHRGLFGQRVAHPTRDVREVERRAYLGLAATWDVNTRTGTGLTEAPSAC